MDLEPTGAFKFQLMLKETNNLNGDWGPTDWLYYVVIGNSSTNERKKLRTIYSDKDALEKYLLTAKQCRLLINLVFDFQSSRFASVINKIGAVKEDDDYRDIETYILWFFNKSFGRSDLTKSEEITAASSPDLHQALLLLDKKHVEIVPIIFGYVTDFVLNAETQDNSGR